MTGNPVEHIGKDSRRCKMDGGSGEKESIFAEAWRETNNPPRYLNHGVGTLQWLLHSEYVNPEHAWDDGLRWNGEVTQEEATVAATVIQWLGTND